MNLAKKPIDPLPHAKGDDLTGAGPLKLAAIGLESEFGLVVDGQEAKPEDVFGTPQQFIREKLMHRQGTSYHLPNGGAVYFDTGVIEIATPVIEIAPECAARAGRSLWEGIRFVREELDAWEARTGRTARLVGFSTHYNVSFDVPAAAQGSHRTVEKLAHLLVHLLPVPAMLLGANKRSTGIGVRPRGNRIEITADFTPSPALMIATATLITGVVRHIMQWPSYELDELDRRGLPVIEGFVPMKHTSRQGWLARKDCYPQNPFAADPNARLWTVRPAYHARHPADPRTHLSLRDIAVLNTRRFRRSIRRFCDPFTLRLINDVLLARAPSLLDLADRPDAYEHVGRIVSWDDLFPEALLARSRYERVLIRAIAGRKLRLGGEVFTPLRLRGWAEVLFRRPDGTRQAFSLDFLADRLDAWR